MNLVLNRTVVVDSDCQQQQSYSGLTTFTRTIELNLLLIFSSVIKASNLPCTTLRRNTLNGLLKLLGVCVTLSYLQVIFLVKLFYFSVVLDTNQWYHSTKIVPTGELSITIGAEYD